MKRNRAQRKASHVYQLDTLYRAAPSSLPLTQADLQAGPASIIDFGDLRVAEIEDVIFLSVPVTTSAHSCERLRDMTRAAFKDQKLVVVLTHNIELLRARKLKPGEASRVLGNIQEYQDVAAQAAGETEDQDIDRH